MNMVDLSLPVLHYRRSTLDDSHFPPKSALILRKNICKVAGEDQVPSSNSPNM